MSSVLTTHHESASTLAASLHANAQSFIQAQKFSVRRTLEKGFRKYLTQSSDYFELIMHELQRLMRQSQTFQQLKSGKRIGDPVEADTEQPALEVCCMCV